MRSARPKALSISFALMVGVDAAQVVDMERHARVIDETSEKFDGQVHVEACPTRARVNGT